MIYYLGDKIKKNEMRRACSRYWVGERRVQDFGGESWGKKTSGEIQVQMGG